MKINKFMMLVGLAVMASLTITSCKVDEPNTNPLDKQGVNLVAFGPNPVARGGYMRFMGTGMNQITSITLAGQELTPLELVSNEEVKVLIPQDAKIGDVVLKTAAGEEIVGKRQVTYTEPVGFDAEKPFEPATIKAGQDLTINGEYLNLVTKVILPNDIEITNFKEKDRKHIVIANIPAEAQTGKVILSFVATGDTIAQEIPSEAKLEVVLPTVDLIEAKEVHANQVIPVAGKDLDLVTAVLSTTGDSLIYEVADDAKMISIRMPEVVMNGTVNLVVASGIQVPAILVGVALPKVTSIEGNTGVKAESVITINGTDLAIVSGINFVDINGNAVAAAADGLSITDTKVTVALPAAAVTGKFTILTTANINIDSTLFAIETLKPAVTEFNPAEVAMGGSVAINGTDLDLVAKVTLTGGAELKPADGGSATTINITIPYADAETGEVKLTMDNGETVVPEVKLTINAPECCYATAWPDPEVEIKAGTMMTITVANIDKLTGVKIDGQDCQIIKIGDQLYIAIPESAGKNSVITLVSENGSIDYPYAFVPNTEQKRTLWKGIQPLSWGTPPEGQVHIQYDDVFKSAPVGAELVICYTQPVADWPQMQFNNGSWQAQKDLVNPDGSVFTNADGAVAPKSLYGDVTEPTYRETSLILTADVLSSLVAGMDEYNNILHLQGADFILNEVFLRWTISLETVLATGNWEAMGWANQPTILASGALSAAGAKPGQTLRIYVTANDGWSCQIVSGWWTAIGTDKYPFDGSYDLAAHNGALEIVLDEAAIAGFDTEGIVVNGDGLVITKITLE